MIVQVVPTISHISIYHRTHPIIDPWELNNFDRILWIVWRYCWPYLLSKANTNCSEIFQGLLSQRATHIWMGYVNEQPGAAAAADTERSYVFIKGVTALVCPGSLAIYNCYGVSFFSLSFYNIPRSTMIIYFY